MLSLLKLPAARLSRHFCQHARPAVPGSSWIASHAFRQTDGVAVLASWDGERDGGTVLLGPGSAEKLLAKCLCEGVLAVDKLCRPFR